MYGDELSGIRAVRYEAIAELRGQGLTYDQIAAAVGVTKARVQQLLKKDPKA